MKKALVILLGLLVVAPTARAASRMTEAERGRVKAEIEAAVNALLSSARAADLEGCFANASGSADYRGIDNGILYRSARAWKDAFQDGFGRLRSQDIRVDTLDVLVLTPDLATSTGHGTFTSTSKTGDTTPRRPFAWTFLWRREDGRWKMIQAHQSFGPIEAAAAEAVPPASCDAALGAWEYLDPSGPGRATVSKLANGRQLLQWIMVPRGGGPTVAGAWEATCEGARRRWRILFSTNPDGVGSEVTEEFEIEGDTIRFWILGPDGKRGDEGRAHRLK
jgi:ketosteroid isomerase-like protein